MQCRTPWPHKLTDCLFKLWGVVRVDHVDALIRPNELAEAADRLSAGFGAHSVASNVPGKNVAYHKSVTLPGKAAGALAMRHDVISNQMRTKAFGSLGER